MENRDCENYTFNQIWSTFIIPVICIVGALFNFICTCIFLQLKSKVRVFKWLLTNSITNIFYLVQCSFVFLIKCECFCSFSRSYNSALYQYISYSYFSNVLALFGIFIKIVISCQHLSFLIGSKYCVFIKSTKIILTCLFFISVIFYIPLLYVIEVHSETVYDGNSLNSTIKLQYFVTTSEYGNSPSGKLWMLLISFIRLIILVLVLTILTIFVYVKYKKLIFLNNNSLNENKNQGKLFVTNHSGLNLNISLIKRSRLHWLWTIAIKKYIYPIRNMKKMKSN